MTETRRDPRHNVTMQGRYRTGTGVARDVVVTDLSTTGCKFDDRVHNLRRGTIISIRIGNIGPIAAQAMWIEDGSVGARFDSALHASVLDHMLVTIDGWTAPPKPSEPQPARPPAHASGSPDGHLARVRPVNLDDARESLRQAGLSLPIVSYQDLVAAFHHLLKIVAKPVPDKGDPAS